MGASVLCVREIEWGGGGGGGGVNWGEQRERGREKGWVRDREKGGGI